MSCFPMHQYGCYRLLSVSTMLSLCLILIPQVTANDEIPGAPQKRPVALINGVVHSVSKPTQPNAVLVFEGGKITQLGPGQTPPATAQVIDLQGQHVYPGLIEAHSELGLKEISAVRATVDTTESGSLNPNVRANISFNPDSELIPVTRANGVLIAVAAPGGGRVRGQASAMQLDGWTYEDMTLEASVGLLINWPSPASKGSKAALQSLQRLFEDARAYRAARLVASQTHAFDIRMESMLPVLNGERPIIAEANTAGEIQTAVAFAAEQNVRLVIFGGHDAEDCAELLKRHGVPVIIDSVYRTPMRRHEAYDTPYTLPARLKATGVTFCISGSRANAMGNVRNLPYHASMAVAHGLNADDALRAVTLFPAQILGIEDRVGSLEIGKDATLIVTTGDPLETTTQVTHAWVRGRKVQLTSRHTRLNDKYRQKQLQLQQAGG